MRVEEWLQAACDRFVNQGLGGGPGEVGFLSSAVAARTSTLAPSEVLSCSASPTMTVAIAASLKSRDATRWRSAPVMRLRSFTGCAAEPSLYVSTSSAASAIACV